MTEQTEKVKYKHQQKEFAKQITLMYCQRSYAKAELAPSKNPKDTVIKKYCLHKPVYLVNGLRLCPKHTPPEYKTDEFKIKEEFKPTAIIRQNRKYKKNENNAK